MRNRLLFNIIENSMYFGVSLLLPFYLMPKDSALHIPGLVIISPLVFAALINLLLFKYIETPCNASYQLTSKVLICLRICLVVNSIIKIDGYVSWDWSTTFWPYWCSFAIHGILTVASIIIFFNTICAVIKMEASNSDVIGSGWAALLCLGFIFATLFPIMQIVKIYDSEKLLTKYSSVNKEYAHGVDITHANYEKLNDNEKYSYNILMYESNMIAF
mmetsp:Transcript_53817/g.73744  ORF Transcript_53817/g.73744 Transcript_53817/m.73744 type:complete len:217 (-) Transcript_53817:1112-1762(-)